MPRCPLLVARRPWGGHRRPRASRFSRRRASRHGGGAALRRHGALGRRCSTPRALLREAATDRGHLRLSRRDLGHHPARLDCRLGDLARRCGPLLHLREHHPRVRVRLGRRADRLAQLTRTATRAGSPCRSRSAAAASSSAHHEVRNSTTKAHAEEPRRGDAMPPQTLRRSSTATTGTDLRLGALVQIEPAWRSPRTTSNRLSRGSPAPRTRFDAPIGIGVWVLPLPAARHLIIAFDAESTLTAGRPRVVQRTAGRPQELA